MFDKDPKLRQTNLARANEEVITEIAFLMEEQYYP